MKLKVRIYLRSKSAAILEQSYKRGCLFLGNPARVLERPWLRVELASFGFPNAAYPVFFLRGRYEARNCDRMQFHHPESLNMFAAAVINYTGSLKSIEVKR